LYTHISPFFFNEPATSSISTLSLHDALPISMAGAAFNSSRKRIPAPSCGRNSGVAHFDLPSLPRNGRPRKSTGSSKSARTSRSEIEEHTSELQSRSDLVCRLLLEKKNKKQQI